MDKELLVRRLELVIDHLDVMHQSTIVLAAKEGIEPAKLQTTSGELMLVQIFTAQAQALSALALLIA